MGLLTKEMKINVTHVWKYYESLGYDIPKTEKIYYHKSGSIRHRRITVTKGTTIMVNINDVPKNNCNQVDVECDCCKKRYKMKYQTYNQIVDDNGMIYCRDCYGQFRMIGDKNPKWNFDKTDDERLMGRYSYEYAQCIKAVLHRDHFICQCCGKHNEDRDMRVHHLDSYDWCFERRYDETNGVTLCDNCHTNFHSMYGYGNNTKQQYEEWIGNSIELLQYTTELPKSKRIYCFETDTVYISAKEAALKLMIGNTSAIYEICNHVKNRYTVNGYHFVYETEFLTMTQEEKELYISKSNKPKQRMVICVTDLKLFNSLADAAKEYNVTSSAICACCKQKHRFTIDKITQRHLEWLYYEDYIKLYGELDLEESVA